jgi:predicted metal-binding membrane protein
MRVVAEQRGFVFLVGSLVVLAWLVLWLGGQSPYGRYLNHDELRLADFGNGRLMLLIVAGWVLMIVAMMLPTSVPLIAMFQRLTRQRAARVHLVLLLVAGYLCIWTLFGVVALLGDGLLHAAIDHSGWLNRHAWIIGVGMLVVAGLYQFSPLKYYCLEKCRSPLHFIATHWQGRQDRLRAFQLGLRHGLFCIGCCWSLMLLMFAVGMGNLGWMLVLGAVMGVEKNLPWGRSFSAPVGIILLCWGGLEALLMLA